MWSKLSARTKELARAVLAIAVVLFLIQVAEVVWYHGYKGAKLKSATQAFSFDFPDSSGRVLVVGDSTGAGTGADRPEDTIAGQLYRDGYSVWNFSEWGALTREVLDQLSRASVNKYDLVLIFTGGNDIIWFQNLNQTLEDFKMVLDEAEKIGERVVVMPPGNIGLAPMFKEPIGMIYESRTRFLREGFIKETERRGDVYVDLFSKELDEIFSGDPNKYFAEDFLHPSSETYELWYGKLQEALKGAEIFFKQLDI